MIERTFFMRGAVITFALLAVATIALHKPKTVIMTLTASGWKPQQLTIQKGDSVLFRTDTGQAFWPASNFHPAHTLYPEFDPKRPIAANDTWTFTFARVGVWTMHDHLAPSFTATVIVTGAPGEAQRQCQERAAKNSELDVACWESEIVDALRDGGLTKGFDVFDKLYKTEPMFQANCHDVSHILGNEAYKLFTADHSVIDNPDTAYCGYGFYHGFIESMLLTEGPGQYNDARAYCDELRTKDGDAVAGPCFHGIGHAVFDSLDSSLWGNASKMADAGIAICERALASEHEQDRVQCSTGVYNALGNALSSQDYYLSLKTTDIIALCKAQKPKYQPGCIVQAGIGYIRYKNMDRTTAIAFVLSLGPSLAPAGISTYIDNEVLREIKTFDPKAYSDTCRSFSTFTYQRSCVEGAVAALQNLGDPHQEYIPMFSFCDEFPAGALRTACYTDAIRSTRRLNTAYQPYTDACQAIKNFDTASACPR